MPKFAIAYKKGMLVANRVIDIIIGSACAIVIV